MRYLRVPKISAALQPDKVLNAETTSERKGRQNASEVIWSLVKDSLEALKKVVEIVDTNLVGYLSQISPLTS